MIFLRQIQHELANKWQRFENKQPSGFRVCYAVIWDLRENWEISAYLDTPTLSLKILKFPQFRFYFLSGSVKRFLRKLQQQCFDWIFNKYIAHALKVNLDFTRTIYTVTKFKRIESPFLVEEYRSFISSENERTENGMKIQPSSLCQHIQESQSWSYFDDKIFKMLLTCTCATYSVHLKRSRLNRHGAGDWKSPSTKLRNGLCLTIS